MAKDKRANPQQKRAPPSPERATRPFSGPAEEPESAQSVNHPTELNHSGGNPNETLQEYDLDAELDIDHILQQEAEVRNPETN
ncbi:hypothetical protein N7513_003253 [Penicillium frequentans]|nr:hypothetical protein N7513_003253 [Penicillium glabrum]